MLVILSQNGVANLSSAYIVFYRSQVAVQRREIRSFLMSHSLPVTQTQKPSVSLNVRNICVLPRRPRNLAAPRRPAAAAAAPWQEGLLSKRSLPLYGFLSFGWLGAGSVVPYVSAEEEFRTGRRKTCFTSMWNISEHRADRYWLLRSAFKECFFHPLNGKRTKFMGTCLNFRLKKVFH